MRKYFRNTEKNCSLGREGCDEPHRNATEKTQSLLTVCQGSGREKLGWANMIVSCAGQFINNSHPELHNETLSAKNK